MNHDPSNSMFWVGALMVFAPIVFAGVVIGVWWYQRKKAAQDRPRPSGRDPSVG